MAFLLLFAVAGGASAAYVAVKKYYPKNEMVNDSNICVDDIEAEKYKYNPVLEDLTTKFKSIETKALESFYNRNISQETLIS